MICSSASQVTSADAEVRTSAGGITSVPPTARIGQVSHTDASNPGLLITCTGLGRSLCVHPRPLFNYYFCMDVPFWMLDWVVRDCGRIAALLAGLSLGACSVGGEYGGGTINFRPLTLVNARG